MFDRTARRYDLVNDLLSLGQDRVWRKVTAEVVDAGPGELVLDLAAGTGTSSLTFTELGARAIACDFSLGMLRTGAERLGAQGEVNFIAGDGLRLPFADDSFDVVTISFGLRNMHDTVAALREMHRVARPGGRLVVAEFSRPTIKSFDVVYTQYLMRMFPAVARLASSNPDSYAYLAESIRTWPDQAALARLVIEAGWHKVAWRNLSLGIVALHRGVKPLSAR
ncbi:demethylmenaquinone methyltransferase [Sinosporangium siamense]|uniref:Demethylmenaquinone methyltransferase n=2 Tax=Sinosporangium siamense TaxID=1367973 RepID=A0A919RKI2_9ACTN|nr:demethylmenaquinone methyltransferase [Sinosporangium siamense]